MLRAIKFAISLPVLIFLALFAGSNREPVTLGLWPTDYSVTIPAALAILGAAAIAFFLGGLLVWIGAFPQRRALRRAEEAVRLLEDQLRAAKARTMPPPDAPSSVLPHG